MSRFARVGIVVGGYVLAFVAAGVAAWLYDVQVSSLPYDTSGGMYAGGQALTSIGVFLGVSLVPTVLGLWFLRRHEPSWRVVAIGALVFAVAGLLAVVVTLAIPARTGSVPLMLVELLGLAQLLGVPLWTLAFVLFAALAPSRASRRTLLAAVGVELVIGVLAILHWFVPTAFR